MFDKLGGVGDAIAGIYAGDRAIATMVADGSGHSAAGARIDRAAQEAVSARQISRRVEVAGEAI